MSNQSLAAFQFKLNEDYKDLSLDINSKLRLLCFEIIKNNSMFNIVPEKYKSMVDSFYFTDAIVASQIIRNSCPNLEKIYDFSANFCFPGVIFGILYPQVQVVIHEPDSGRQSFFSSYLASHGIKNISFETKPIETYPERSLKHLIFRTPRNISKGALLARKVVALGGEIFNLKGDEWSIEVAEMPVQLFSIWEPSLVGEYKIFGQPGKFSVVRLKKIGN